MNSQTKHKVCFEIDGIPAINRIISNFKEAGVRKVLTVVGSMAGQVIECVGNAHEDVGFVFQKVPMGTGDAAQKGIQFIQTMGIGGPVLISYGDKLIEPSIIREQLKQFQTDDLDATFAIQPKRFNPSGGRIVFDEQGRIRGIAESIDVKTAIFNRELEALCENAQAENADLEIRRIRELSEVLFKDVKKRLVVLSKLEPLISEKERCSPKEILARLDSNKKAVHFGTDEFDPYVIEDTPYVNAALYLFKPQALYAALKELSTDNAEQETYLTDVINILANTRSAKGEFLYKVDALRVEDQKAIMSFNNAQELLEIENHFAREKEGLNSVNDLTSDVFKPVGHWISIFTEMSRTTREALHEIYGNDSELIEERREAFLKVLMHFENLYGTERKVLISRSPGRVNLMGRHVEHRGGNINVISINKEVIAVVSPRKDDIINITNTDSEFPNRTFSISDHLVTLNWKDWLSYLESDETKKMVTNYQGDWMNYVKAAVLRLQYLFRDRKLVGMDMAFDGNIPRAAGLSSSSAMVVATAEALVVLNQLDVTPQKFVDLCGEGEWFVGSRGGAGDHAAMKFGQRGYIAHMGFFPFAYQGAFKFPEKFKLLVANSHVKAQKTSNAKDVFNQRVASYEFGLMLIKAIFPQYAHLLDHLRDINPQALGLKPSKIYELLLALPETLSPNQLFEVLPEVYHPAIRKIMQSHKAPEKYLIRSVVLYGVAECERARACQKMLERGAYEDFGRIMNVSHDGDRVVYHDERMQALDYDWSVSDDKLRDLIQDLQSEDPDRIVNAQLARQPGGYACSTAEIDFMIDVTKQIPGVVGAQISGAGLGGCIMVLAKEEAVDKIIFELERQYYSPRGLNSAITVCTPVKGSSVIRL